MSTSSRRSQLVAPGLIASAAILLMVFAISSWALRSVGTNRRFNAWERASSLAPGECLVWNALLHATNRPSPKPPPGELRPIEGRMRRVFGYNQFTLIEQAENRITSEGDNWFVPTDQIYLGMKLLGVPKNGKQAVNLKIWRQRELLVDADATVRMGSPLFIRGPLKGDGQLIFVVMVVRAYEPVPPTPKQPQNS